jgi:predicted nucleotidyltransferase
VAYQLAPYSPDENPGPTIAGFRAGKYTGLVDSADPDVATLRSFIHRARSERTWRLAGRLEHARSDFRRILDMVASEFDPDAVYQWGSLLEDHHFQEISDIDMAVSGILDAQTFFRLCARAQDLSDFPVHIVQMETIEPSYAASIKKRGRLIHERPVR